MPSVSLPTAMAGSAALSAGAGIGSALIGSGAAKGAANTQAETSLAGMLLQQGEFNQVQNLLAPFVQGGTGALGDLQALLGLNGGNPQTSPLFSNIAGAELPGGVNRNVLGTTSQLQGSGTILPSTNALAASGTILPQFAQIFGNQPGGMQSWLSQTPGYQFTLGQGLQATQNAFAAQGLGQSGAALKGAANYAEGLAGTTFQQQFQNFLTSQAQTFGQTLGANAQTFGQDLSANAQRLSQILGINSQKFGQNLSAGNFLLNPLSSLVGLGESAGAGTGALGMQSATNQSQLLTGAGAALAGGTVGSANALTSGLGTIAGAGQNYALLSALQGMGMFGGGSGSSLSPAAFGNIGAMPATGLGSPSDAQSNLYAQYLGIPT